MKACTAIAVLICAFAARAEDTFRELRWRSVGPYRGGRTKAAAGVPGKPGLFYVGAVNGGVWRTDDYGRTWTPIFDGQPTGSIGAIAVAPSNPDVIYVGSGEGLQRPDLSTGDGVYKSTDGGKTWRHLGLRDAQQIPQIAVDPRDPDRLFVAVLGHPYGPSEERGVFRSVDGGATFQKVLYRDPDTGAADVLLDPSDPGTVFATAAAPGAASPRDSRTSSTAASGASASASRRPRPGACSSPWRRRRAAGCTARTTRARAGRASRTMSAWPSAPTTSPK